MDPACAAGALEAAGVLPRHHTTSTDRTDQDLSPVLVHTFEHLVTGIVEVEPDVFIVSLSDAYTTHESHLARVDLNGWAPGEPVSPDIIVTFDERVRGLSTAAACSVPG
ncbi:MAG: hypothetical protein JO115_18280 [Pseudonocardiales bacterium]|nr:hypothetical protein [Pseudonocardiales bacterium]